MTTTKKSGVILVNLGSPASTSVEDVREYLAEFLMDENVLDYPAWLRKLIVQGFILPKRPAHSAEAYEKIWWEEGSPLVVLSEQLHAAVQAKMEIPVVLGMRYGQPSIGAGIQELLDQGIDNILLVPLYPQYAMSTTVTVVEMAEKELAQRAPETTLNVLSPFYDHPQYIDALVENTGEYLGWDYDHVLFSFHGLPERHLHKTDPTGQHCLKMENCCQVDSPAHNTCYRHQAYKSMEAFAQKAGLESGKYSLAFQSRLGRDVWLSPAAANEIQRLGESGIKKLLVLCPSFVTDCLETLEEIEMGGAEIFKEAGGEEFRMAPCLNTNPKWVSALVEWSETALAE